MRFLLEGPALATYVDEGGNFVINGFILEEKVENISSTAVKPEIEEKTNLYKKFEKLIQIEKFNNRAQNPRLWFKEFEKECERHKIPESSERVDALCFFVSEGAMDWYKSAKLRLEIDNWEDWRNEFIESFCDRGWSLTSTALNYRYLGGSLVDYMMRKERLLIESDPGLPNQSRLNVIMASIPANLHDRFDHDRVKDIKSLLSIAGRVDVRRNEDKQNNISSSGSQGNKPTKQTSTCSSTSSDRKCCPVCQALGWSGRFHPIESCRNISKGNVNANINSSFKKNDGVKMVNNAEVENLLNTQIDQKN